MYQESTKKEREYYISISWGVLQREACSHHSIIGVGGGGGGGGGEVKDLKNNKICT